MPVSILHFLFAFRWRKALDQSDVESIKCQRCPHIETSQLKYTVNQLTGFYMRATLALNGLNSSPNTFSICMYVIPNVFLIAGGSVTSKFEFP